MTDVENVNIQIPKFKLLYVSVGKHEQKFWDNSNEKFCQKTKKIIFSYENFRIKKTKEIFQRKQCTCKYVFEDLSTNHRRLEYQPQSAYAVMLRK